MPLSTITNPFLDPAGSVRSNVSSPAANTIAITTSGTERVRVDSSGNMGVGLTNASTYGRFAVNTPTSGYGVVSVRDSVAGGGGAQLAVYYGTFKYNYIDACVENGTAGSEQSRLTFATSNAGTLTERMRIDNLGRVTKPFQPAFVARFSGSSKDGSTISPIQFNTAPVNVGSCFNTSTYKFTAPVGGIYSFTAMPAYKESSQDFSWGFSINGGGVTSDNVRVIGSTPNSHSGWTGSLIINLAANDTVEVQFSQGTYHQNGGGFNYFSGILIG